MAVIISLYRQQLQGFFYRSSIDLILMEEKKHCEPGEQILSEVLFHVKIKVLKTVWFVQAFVR